MGYSRILVASDFSENAAHAARWALKLAEPDALVRLLSVLAFPDAPSYLRGPQRDEILSMAAERRQDAQDALVQWAQRAGVPKPVATVREGPPAREISREAVDFGADLVVMGARGMTKVERLLLGSTSRSVIRHVPSDALVVRGEGPGLPRVARVMVATDFYGPSKAAARRARSIAKQAGAELVAYHAIDPGVWAGVAYDADASPTGTGVDEAWLRKTMGDMLHAFNVETMDGAASEVIGRGRAAIDVAEFARSIQADLVVTGTHGAGVLARALLGSVAEGIVERAPCSVLVVRS